MCVPTKYEYTKTSNTSRWDVSLISVCVCACARDIIGGGVSTYVHVFVRLYRYARKSSINT